MLNVAVERKIKRVVVSRVHATEEISGGRWAPSSITILLNQHKHPKVDYCLRMNSTFPSMMMTIIISVLFITTIVLQKEHADQWRSKEIIDFAILSRWRWQPNTRLVIQCVSPFQHQFDVSNPFSGESMSIFHFYGFFSLFFLFPFRKIEMMTVYVELQTCVVYDFHRFRCSRRRFTCHQNVVYIYMEKSKRRYTYLCRSSRVKSDSLRVFHEKVIMRFCRL